MFTFHPGATWETSKDGSTDTAFPFGDTASGDYLFRHTRAALERVSDGGKMRDMRVPITKTDYNINRCSGHRGRCGLRLGQLTDALPQRHVRPDASARVSAKDEPVRRG